MAQLHLSRQLNRAIVSNPDKEIEIGLNTGSSPSLDQQMIAMRKHFAIPTHRNQLGVHDFINNTTSQPIFHEIINIHHPKIAESIARKVPGGAPTPKTHPSHDEVINKSGSNSNIYPKIDLNDGLLLEDLAIYSTRGVPSTRYFSLSSNNPISTNKNTTTEPINNINTKPFWLSETRQISLSFSKKKIESVTISAPGI